MPFLKRKQHININQLLRHGPTKDKYLMELFTFHLVAALTVNATHKTFTYPYPVPFHSYAECVEKIPTQDKMIEIFLRMQGLTKDDDYTLEITCKAGNVET